MMTRLRHVLTDQHPFQHATTGRPADEREAFDQELLDLTAVLDAACAVTEPSAESEAVVREADVALEGAFNQAAIGPGCGCQAAEYWDVQKRRLIGTATALWGASQRIVIQGWKPL